MNDDPRGNDTRPLPAPPFSSIPLTPGWIAQQMTEATLAGMGIDEPQWGPDPVLEAAGDIAEPFIPQLNLAIVAGIAGLALVGLGVGGFAVYRLTR